MRLNDRRLDSLATGLSARERAVWRLRAFKEDAPEPNGLYRSTPGHQIPEVNDLLALANATHREITWYAIWLQARAETAALRSSLASLLSLKGSSGITLEDPRLARLSEAITETVAAELTELWSELLALDEVVREVGEKFDGEEPLHPECRALLDTTRERVLALAKALPPSFGELILPPEPAPRVRHALAAIIEQEARLP